MEYFNSANATFTINYTGTVNYYRYDENNSIIDYSFQCINACFRIDSLGKIYWQSGQFLSGVWDDGQWRNMITNDNGETWQQSQQVVSFWKNGIWNNGKFYKGQWENGFFNSGDFYFGYWFDGVFGYNSLISQTSKAVWHDGYFFGGVFAGTLWQSGAFYTTSDIKSYWLVRDKDNYRLWQGGTINDIYSNSSPQQTVYNNGQYRSVSGRVSYLIITNQSYEENSFVCANASFVIDTVGKIQLMGGNYYNGKFVNTKIQNSTLNGFELQQCEIFNTNIYQSSVLLNCVVTSNSRNTISNCQWYNGVLYGYQFDKSIWYDGQFDSGYFSNSIWYNGQWYNSYWDTNSQWYGGIWNSGYIDYQPSNTSPYIVGNNKTYDSFTGQLLYTCNQQSYIIVLTNASISIDENGIILFTDGVWEDGVFNNGSFINGTWKNGTFNNGSFQNSIWEDGVFNNGSFYSSVWESGTFNDGTFERSNWNDGYFYGGTFKSGNWNDGYFVGGNWITLNSFWFGGVWVGGTQNGLIPTNQSKNFYSVYLTQNQLIDNTYTIQLMYLQFAIFIVDKNGDRIELQSINEGEQFNEICYYVKDGKLYLCFPHGIDDYYQLKYAYILSDASPKTNFVDDDLLQYLNKDVKNIVTGQFTYIVNQQYYTISVQDANFSIQNGFIIWNTGKFKDGIWYDGQWNVNSSQLFQIIQPLSSTLLLKLQQCIWQNGIWMHGNWNYNQSKWISGQWIDGTINGIQSNQPPNFQLGNSKNYTNYHGTVKYIYDDQKQIKHFGFMKLKDADFQIQSNGYIKFNKGNLIDCYWYNGQWYGDNWYNGQWYNGTWNCGVWHNGIWHNGTWKTTISNPDDIQISVYKQGNFRPVGVRYVDTQYQIPIRGFFILEGQQQEYDNDYGYSQSCQSEQSENSYANNNQFGFDQWTDQQYERFYGNVLNDINSSNSTNSESSYEYSVENKIAVLVKKWVDSQWVQGFIEQIKSFYPPMYGVANGNQYKDFTDDLVYHYPVYNYNGEFLYKQYFFIRCQDSSFKVDNDGNIYWYGGRLLNGQWNNGQWKNGIFINGKWKNGIWRNGYFTSGTFENGTWENGYITTKNLKWINGQWKTGYISTQIVHNGEQQSEYLYMKSNYSPILYTANNTLFINYTGVVKYYNTSKLEYYKIDVSNACFFVSQNGKITFYNGVWNDGTFIGDFTTAQFNSRNYDYLLQQIVIKMNQTYFYENGSQNISYTIRHQGETLSSNDTNLFYFFVNKNGVQQQVQMFFNTNSVISTWINGVFASGTWHNGQWIDGEWLTDDENNPIGIWKTGVINNIIEKQPPAYQIISDEKDYYHFVNFTGRVKYKVNFFNDKTFKITSYFQTFNCKNAFFDIKYYNAVKSNKQYRQILIQWKDGVWVSGTFHHGVWKNGTWMSGTWQMGKWLNGTWEKGTWISGVWHNGIWKNGARKQISILNMIYY